MGRNEIKFRRQTMTSRRIDRHKNYEALMRRHRRTSRVRLVFKLVVGGLVVVLLVYLYFFFAR